MGLITMRRVIIATTAILISAFVSYCSIPVAHAHNSGSAVASSANACPFCSAIALTFSEQMNSSDIVVVAKLIEIPPPPTGPDADFPKATFEILKTLKGTKFVGEGLKFKTQLVGTYPLEQKFLVMGVDPPNVAWTTPMKASDRVFNYLELVQKLPEGGPDRLVFFQDYFEDKESVLAFDAYDEFARAPYEDLIAMKDQMQHDKIIGWIKDTDTSVNRKRLYFTMLGVCGTKDDVQLLEDLITSGSRKKRAGLDALIACYLMLKGESGVDLIEKTFLVDKEVDYVDTLAAVSALRFHGTESDVISKKRIVKAIRQLLDRPKMADMIIPDLARWEDWSVMERLVEMFKNADPESNWLRVPVITYLRACPKPEAKKYIDELQKIDPEAVKRADFFLGFDEGGDDWDDEESTDSDDSKTEKKSDEKAKDDKKVDDKKVDDKKVDDKKVDNSLPPQPDDTELTDLSTNLCDDQVTVVETSEEPGGDLVVQELPLSLEDQGTFATASDAEVSATSHSSLESTETSFPSPPEPALVEPSSKTVFVSSPVDPIIAQPTTAPVAQPVSPPAPIAVVEPEYNLTWLIIFVPMASAAAIFLLLWSVVNGWFERLIF
jgi:hypothetical protein